MIQNIIMLYKKITLIVLWLHVFSKLSVKIYTYTLIIFEVFMELK